MTLDLDTLMRQMTEQKAKDALLTARSTLERNLRELDHYIERLDTAETPPRPAASGCATRPARPPGPWSS